MTRKPVQNIGGATGKGFMKGRSGNPGGRPRIIGEIRELAREHTADAVDALVKVCKSGKSESARVAAASALLDRGYGKPVQSVHSTPHDPAELTDSELARIAAGGSDGTHSSAEGSTLAH